MINDSLKSYIAIRDERYARLERDYEHAIREAVASYGSTFALSRALRVHERYVANALNSRGVGSGLKTKRQIAQKIAQLSVSA
jgi:hypothetical protein